MSVHQQTSHIVIDTAGNDIGFFSTKLTLGRKKGLVGSEISVMSFPSLAPRVTWTEERRLPNTAESDGVIVDVDGVKYFVGPSSINMADSRGGTRSNNQAYCLTDTYKACFLGSLYFMVKAYHADGSLTIKRLVMGLPLNTVFDHAETVKQMAVGDHIIPSPFQKGKDIKVHIKDVTVVAQPQGAVCNYAVHGGDRKIKPKHNLLVLDMGGGTFDWFVCNGEFQPNYNLCGAAPIGSLSCASVICEQIKSTFKASPIAMDRVDTALRENSETFEIGGNEYQMADYWPAVEGLLGDAITQMKNQVGDLDVLDHILLTGGGATILSRVCNDLLPGLTKIIKLDSDPVFSNVKGFFEIAVMIGD